MMRAALSRATGAPGTRGVGAGSGRMRFALLQTAMVALAAGMGALLAAAAPSPAPAPRAAPVAARPELWATSDQPVANGAFASDGALVASLHPIFRRPLKLMTVRPGAPGRPWPDAAFQAMRAGGLFFDQVQGLRTDSRGVIWVVDMGGKLTPLPRLIAWDSRSNRLQRIITLPRSVSPRGAQPQDLAIDERRGLIYLADEAAGQGQDGSNGALIVVDLKTGGARRVLQGVPGTAAEKIDIVVDGRPMRMTDPKTGKATPMRSGADGIALDAAGEWLHFGPLNGHSTYRVRTADLGDLKLSERELEKRVERYADRPNAGGYLMDRAGNLYLTEIEHRAVGVIDPQTRRYRRVVESPDMLWPDGLTAGPDGMVYVVTSKLPTAAAFNGGADRAKPPWPVFRFRPLAPPV